MGITSSALHHKITQSLISDRVTTHQCRGLLTETQQPKGTRTKSHHRRGRDSPRQRQTNSDQQAKTRPSHGREHRSDSKDQEPLHPMERDSQHTPGDAFTTHTHTCPRQKLNVDARAGRLTTATRRYLWMASRAIARFRIFSHSFISTPR